ncbi:type II toxin-antitoxin system VapC family toxin [Endozoicomonas sp. YOMI1]|uniref:type II toxin-antitoxin system VapC family toxin n=1 Tax=Endozoicomonas sp. YOMI1 TaxID=2828739 RepID=UPI002147872D|nr:type II toxin-antitoxin system VapC family toxin [Endozoicomonas sp. YOMI1]
MKRIFLDTCILIDASNRNSEFCSWSRSLLSEIRDNGSMPGFISPIVFSEFSAAFQTTAEVVAQIEALELTIQHPCVESLHLAARKHIIYRRNGGRKTGTLSDFFIGSQAVVEKGVLATRDVTRFKTYFSTLQLITPDNQGLSLEFPNPTFLAHRQTQGKS